MKRLLIMFLAIALISTVAMGQPASDTATVTVTIEEYATVTLDDDTITLTGGALLGDADLAYTVTANFDWQLATALVSQVGSGVWVIGDAIPDTGVAGTGLTGTVNAAVTVTHAQGTTEQSAVVSVTLTAQ